MADAVCLLSNKDIFAVCSDEFGVFVTQRELFYVGAKNKHNCKLITLRLYYYY